MLELFLTFLKIGTVSFGGGYGMISVLKDEVISHGYLTSEQLLNFIAVAESTPGPIAINMATFVGSSQYGFWGALLATLGVVLPAFTIILIISALISGLMKFAGVQGALNGVRPVVVGLIIGTGLTIAISVIFGIKDVNSTFSFDYRALIIFATVGLISTIYKIKKKKSFSVILLIIISAILGIILYGFLGGI